MSMDTVQSLSRSTPERQGISSRAIERFIGSVQDQGLELHSFMLLRRGHVIAEGWWDPYGPELPHMLFSLSKSFTSTAIGLLAEEGRIALTDPVIGFFPEYAPEAPSENLAAMTVRDLLVMGTGHAAEPALESEDWVADFFKQPVEHEPGTHFVYNSAATYMLSAILQKITGKTLLEYLEPRLFEPLAIHGATWESCPRGINAGGWGLKLKTEDIAKFGQLYLQKGVWGDKRLIPEAWVLEATSKQISNGPADGSSDWTEGYGYQFWRCRHGAYRGDGAFGQYCIVHPELEAVIAITSGLNDMQAVLNSVWEHLLPAFEPEALPENEGAAVSLTETLGALNVQPPKLAASSTREQDVSGIVFELEENEQKLRTFCVRFSEEEALLEIEAHYGLESLTLGRNAWAEGTTRLFRMEEGKVCSSMTWNDKGNLVITLRAVETPFCLTMEADFTDGGLHLAQSFNVSFGDPGLKPITGQAREGQ